MKKNSTAFELRRSKGWRPSAAQICEDKRSKIVRPTDSCITKHTTMRAEKFT